jgi:hypothetical protein
VGPPRAAKPARKPGTRRFMLMLKADKNTESELDPGGAAPGVPANEALMQEMGALMGELAAKGALLGGDGLKPSSKGSRITYSGDKRSVVDGPFTESKELIAGYCVIQVPSMAEAVDIARRMLEIHVRGTDIDHGENEVRPIFELEDFPVDPAEKPDGWRDRERAFRERAGQ